VIREASRSDAAAVAAVTLAAGQPSGDSGADSGYYDLLLRTGTVLVAEAGEHLLGWGAVRTRSGASMLTDLFVDPAHHGQGIGGRLLERLWPAGTGAVRRRFTFSSLHPHALPLYVRAGVVPRWPLLYLVGPGVRVPRANLAITVVAADEAAAAEERLAGRNGSTDVPLYRYWEAGPASAALLVADGGRVVAAGAVRPGEVAHLSCAAGADVVGIVAAVVSAAAPNVRLCVPGPHPALRALLDWGFRIEEMDLALSSGISLSTTDIYSSGLG
jgi:GNAT superfamily N-acetyltransferase